jgi:hypothetical protein
MLPSHDNDHGRVTELFLAFSCHVDEMINNSLIIMDGRYVISLNFRWSLHVPAPPLNPKKRKANSFHPVVSKLRPHTHASLSAILSMNTSNLLHAIPPPIPRARLHFPKWSKVMLRHRQATFPFRGQLSTMRSSGLVPFKPCQNFDKRSIVSKWKGLLQGAKRCQKGVIGRRI